MNQNEQFQANLADARILFREEDAVIRIKELPTMIIGDLHGDLEALNMVISIKEELEPANIIFLGDYVDRGRNSAEVLSRLLKLKIASPKNVFLLRGNHETKQMNEKSGFFDELKDSELFNFANIVFEEMPVAAVINKKIFCVHGGIEDIRKTTTITKQDSFNYLWNDPSEIRGLNFSIRGRSIRTFGPDIVEGFLRLNDLQMIIRAHSSLDTGYKWWFGNKLLSIHSTLNNHGTPVKGAVCLIKKDQLDIYTYGKTGDGARIIDKTRHDL
ncbi:MAG: bis(5'nucleosyl)-tetraphosphatase, ApaH [Methanohalophilus sp. T328-1]|jgi:serine/threonine-protein phosphatase PP1 catalytic subunit|nr:MAG: bis(5'nucleosyl)-tetraphosphatase, ApaH [Methanohalophilus sp. T328-1]